MYLTTYLLPYLLTYSMEQSPSWEANLFSGSQGTPRILWNRRFITTFTSVRHLFLSWSRSIHSLLPHPTSWRYSPIYVWVFQVFSFLYISPLNACTHLSGPHTYYMPLPSLSSRFDRPNNTGWEAHIMELPIMQFYTLPSYLVPLRSKYSPQPTFLPQCSDQDSHPYITTSNITLYTIIFTFLDSKLDNKRLCTEW